MGRGSGATTPALEGVWVRLEPMTLEHLVGLEAVAFDDRIWRYMSTWVKTRDDLRGWVETALRLEAAGTVMPWVTILKDENRVIGSTRFMDFDKGHKTTELGSTWLAPEFHESGLNAEAKLLQLRYGFEELGLRRVALKTHHENLQSQAAMRKIGAVEEGTFRNHYVMPDGSQRHSVWFSIIREEWPRVRSLLEARVRATPLSA
jgi:RimJ/RimL family protein N-acetyltransferase